LLQQAVALPAGYCRWRATAREYPEMGYEKAPPVAVVVLAAGRGVTFCVSWYVSWLRADG